MSATSALAIALPVDASTEGWRIDEILYAAHWASCALGIAFLVWLAVILVRDRRSRAACGTHGTTFRERSLPIALAVFVLVAVDGYLLWLSHRGLRATVLAVDNALAGEHIKVQIGARQWGWEVRYAGQDGVFDTEDDIYSSSRLVLPLGIAIVYELGSLDVVHSLYLPNFRVKQDAIPGRVVRGWFAARRLGSYEIACAQHCGVNHFLMAGRVDVVSAEDFAHWQRDMSADGARIFAEAARAADASPTASSRWQAAASTGRVWAWPWPWGARR